MSLAPYIVGIDPGLSGALALYTPAAPELVTAEDLPVVNKELDFAQLAARLRQFKATIKLVVVERVSARPKQGVSSTFKFGATYGGIRAVCATLDLPVHLVAPAVWKRHYKLDADKEKARGLAIQLWPACRSFGRVKDHGRAEAALMARWGAEVLRWMPAVHEPGCGFNQDQYPSDCTCVLAERSRAKSSPRGAGVPA